MFLLLFFWGLKDFVVDIYMLFDVVVDWFKREIFLSFFNFIWYNRVRMRFL